MLKIALKNLLRKRIRNGLTFLGVAIGIALCAMALSIGQHMRNQLGGLLERYQVDLVVQSRGIVTPLQSHVAPRDFDAIRQMQGVRHASSIILGNFRTTFDSMFLIVGVSEADHFFGRVHLLDGEWFIPGRNEILLGEMAARIHGFPLGSRMLLSRDEMMRVSGVYSMGFSFMDAAAIMHIDDARRILQLPDAMNIMFIQSDPDIELDTLIEAINRDFPHLHASRSAELTDQISLLPYIEFMALVISLIAVAACCLIIMNTFFMAVNERVREIGALAAMGWSGWRTGSMFMLEGLMLSCLAWVGGLALASGLLIWSQRTMSAGLAVLPLELSASTIVLTFGLSFVMALCGTLIPVLFVVRMDPADALRQE